MPRVLQTALRCALCVLLLILAACAREVDLHTGLSEEDANEVLAALVSSGIPASKAALKQGYAVRVGTSQLAAAVAQLNAMGLPRHSFARMGDVFKKDGMISSPMEERGRYLYALSQELEATLSRIDGVVLAKVHPVLPERRWPGEPIAASSCAVFIKYKAGFDPALYEERVRMLVQAAIPGLAQGGVDAVSVVFSQVTAPTVSGPMDTAGGSFWWGLLSGAAALLLVAGTTWVVLRRRVALEFLARWRKAA